MAIRWMPLTLAATLIAGVAAIAPTVYARASETPAYTVESKQEGFEIRRYEGRLVAEVEVEGDPNTASNAGFRILANFIFGANEARSEVAMTAPVDRRPAEAIEMTAPVDRRASKSKGEGDDERYRHFCAGRGAGLAAFTAPQLPAATGIGRCDGERTLQVYWLACERPGVAVENPRQLSAWRYPRQYGPVAPKFSRAMRADGRVFVSGTASVVGHETRHADCFDSQVRETIENLAAVLDAAGVRDAREIGRAHV